MHAWGLRLRRVLQTLALPCPPMLPSALLNCVGTLVAIISQLDTQPACAPVNASRPALRLATHDSGTGWLATPFLYGSFIHDSKPVYPGALNKLLIRRWSGDARSRSPLRCHYSSNDTSNRWKHRTNSISHSVERARWLCPVRRVKYT